MASLVAYNDVKDWIVSEWGATYPIVDWEEVDPTLRQSKAPFLALEEQGAIEDIMAVAGIRPMIQETAPFSLHLFWPSTSSHQPARLLGEDVAMKGRQRDLAAGRMNRVHPPVPGVVNDGLWTSMQMDLDYAYYHRPTVERTPVPVLNPIPGFATQPTMDNTNYNVGDTVTFTYGTSTEPATSTIKVQYLNLHGVDYKDEITSDQWDTTGKTPGPIYYRCRAEDDATGRYSYSDIIEAMLN